MREYWNQAPKGMAGVVGLDTLDVRNAVCTLHCSHRIDKNSNSRCGNPAKHFYVADLGGPSLAIIPRCEQHEGSNSLATDPKNDPDWFKWVEMTSKELLDLQLVEETMHT